MVDAPAPTGGPASPPERFADLFGRVCDNVTRVIRGKDGVVELTVLALVAEGHVLVEDVPGVGKTSLAKALARSIDGTFGRVQFTPDLLPADVLGTSVWNQQAGSFEFRAGPVFANVLLADEVNRASPRTQSALLESMAEAQVTVDGRTRPLPRPFVVLATQNPLEHHGTFPLPESQLDRFLMKLSIGYPERIDEAEILATDGEAANLAALEPVVSAEQVVAMAQHCRRVHVSATLSEYLIDLAAATRRHRHLALGMSPRATLGLQRAARVRAAAQGRRHVVPDDVKALAPAVVAHRLVVHPEAHVQRISALDVVADVLDSVPVPADIHLA